MLAPCRCITSSAGRAACWPCGRPSTRASRRRRSSGGRGKDRGSACTRRCTCSRGTGSPTRRGSARRGCGPARRRWCPARRRPTGTGCWSGPRGPSRSRCRARDRRRCPAGVRVRRRDLAAADVVGQRDLRLTAAPLTALETAVALADGSVFLDRALQRHVRFPAVYRAYCRNIGRHGSSAAGRLLVAAADRADSAAERLLVRHPAGRRHRRVGAGPPFRTVADRPGVPASRRSRSRWMGGPGTSTPTASGRTAASRTPSCGPGWDPLRFTWHDLDRRPAAVLDEIEETLRLAEGPSRPRSTG